MDKIETQIGGIEKIDEAVRLLHEGEVVVIPTETVYGLAANALNAKAVKKIFLAKGRPQDNPLIVHIEDANKAKMVAVDIPESAYLLWEEFSPGPLTIVLKKHPLVPYVTTAGLETVGIRIPNNELALETIRRSNLPLAAPSANISGRVSPTEARFVYDDMNGKIPLILDGGPCKVGIESTVLDLTKETPTILRPGAITEDMLSACLGKVVNHKGKVVRAASPGMKYAHYKPMCACFAAKTSDEAKELYNHFTNSLIIARQDFLDTCDVDNKIHLGETPEECMRNYFRILRENENIYDVIIIESFENEPQYLALQNRIAKATEKPDKI